MKLGCHVGNSGSKMLIGSIEEAISYGANCFMVYLGAPQNTVRKAIWEQNAPQMAEIAKKNGINLDDVIVHAPYIVNLARKDEEKFAFAVDFLTTEVKGVDSIGAKYLVLHPGSAVDCTREEAIDKIALGINLLIANTPGCRTVIAIETMAGKGNEMGKTFEEIAEIISKVTDKSRVGVCLDTCHVHDGGYDIVNNYDKVFNDFDNIIGLSYLKVIHANDSKNPIESHKDRHENIGFGDLGFDFFVKLVNDDKLEEIPKILETPYVKVNSNLSVPPYKYEIEMIKNRIFDNNLINKIIGDSNSIISNKF